jgi:hypothetical protein
MLFITVLIAAWTIPEGLNGDGNLLPSLWLAILPLVVATPLVLGASICVGLPLTYFLQRNGRESLNAYCGAGVVVGAVLPIAMLLILAAPAGYWMALFGAFSGAVTGRTWWVTAREPRIRKGPIRGTQYETPGERPC